MMYITQLIFILFIFIFVQQLTIHILEVPLRVCTLVLMLTLVHSVHCILTAFLYTHTLTLSVLNSPNAAAPPIHFPLDLLASA